MEMMNVMYELATTKTALELAEKTIRKQKGKLLRRNILIAGLACERRKRRQLRTVRWRKSR